MARTVAKDYDDKRVHILKTAAKLFAVEGVARASMSQLAHAAGISKANIYHYYDSKDALLYDILDTYLVQLKDRISNLHLAGLTAEEKLHQIIYEILQFYDGMDHEHKIQTEGIPLLPPVQQDILRGYQRDMVATLEAVLIELAPDIFEGQKEKLRATTMSIFGMVNWFYMWNSHKSEAARQNYAELVSKLANFGIKGL